MEDCIHCGSGFEVPGDVHDGQEFVCEDCGGVNVAQVDDDGVGFPTCDQPDCKECAATRAA